MIYTHGRTSKLEIERCLKVSVIWLLRPVIPILTDLQSKLLKQK